MNMRYGLAACGAIAALAVSVAGCSSVGSSTPGPTASSTSGAAAGGTATASANPSWAAALGSGVTVLAPVSASAGNGSPQAVVAGLVADEDAGNFVAACDYYIPSLQSQCKSEMSVVVSASPSALASAVGHVTSFGIGYTAVNGDEALVGTTGTFCSSGSCYTNSDPAALFSAGKSFSTLWGETSDSSSSSYSLAPCIEVGGKWYLHESLSS